MNEAELVLSRILQSDRPSLYLSRNVRLDKAVAGAISSVLKRRIKGEPLAYILGKADFFGLEFNISPDVLVPRPETEILVETALRQSLVVGRWSLDLRILDLGTGSGCIAISLAKELPFAKIDAVDISQGALKVAQENARFHNVEINFRQRDLFSTEFAELETSYLSEPTNLSSRHGSKNKFVGESRIYDLIVSNPPYIRSAEIEGLQPEVRQEPRVALDGGSDGLDFYRRITKTAPRHLEEGGLLVMEMGYNQREAIEKICQGSGRLKVLEVVKDYSGIDRVIVTKKG
ncbi:MAG: peptide chain release factor N(5)-glutamine methyltransferase [Candidatus Omnitrophica bacterium]|nr:peptide chain release factor N(5)-glutamine methyltransferase [Candidatus Omnitrophota bacterium]